MGVRQCAAVCVSLAATGGVCAEVAFTDVERSIEVAFGLAAPSVSEGEFGPGVWDEAVLGSYDDGLGYGSGEATQMSDVSGGVVTATGFVSAFASTDGYTSAYSSLFSFITLTEATSYRASAALLDLFQGNPTLLFSASLFDGSGQELWSMSSTDVALPDTGSYAFADEAGVLGPGTYSLAVLMSVEGIKDATTSGGFSFEFVVPAPGTGAAVVCAALGFARRRRAA